MVCVSPRGVTGDFSCEFYTQRRGPLGPLIPSGSGARLRLHPARSRMCGKEASKSHVSIATAVGVIAVVGVVVGGAHSFCAHAGELEPEVIDVAQYQPLHLAMSCLV